MRGSHSGIITITFVGGKCRVKRPESPAAYKALPRPIGVQDALERLPVLLQVSPLMISDARRGSSGGRSFKVATGSVVHC